jgi:uncharacterized protein
MTARLQGLEGLSRLTAAFADNVRVGAAVTNVKRTGPGVLVRDATGRVERYDHIVIATHADQGLPAPTGDKLPLD